MLKACIGLNCARQIDFIDRRHCNLTVVPDDIYRHERTLEELLLDYNALQDLPPVRMCLGEEGRSWEGGCCATWRFIWGRGSAALSAPTTVNVVSQKLKTGYSKVERKEHDWLMPVHRSQNLVFISECVKCHQFSQCLWADEFLSASTLSILKPPTLATIYSMMYQQQCDLCV